MMRLFQFTYFVAKKLLFTFLFLFSVTSNNVQNLIAQNLSSRHHKNVSTSTVRKIEFSGCIWIVKSGFYGPGPNYWSDSEESVWVDDEGRLHLKIRQIDSKWYCAEVFTQRYTQYGEHRFLIESQVNQLDENVVLGLFTYADDKHEIDIEFSKWGVPNYTKIGSFTVQPYTISGNIERFPIKSDSALSTHFFNWQPNYILFGSIQGHYEDLLPTPDHFIHKWIYWGDYIPESSNKLRTHINLWLLHGNGPVDTTNLEVIINKVFQPLSSGVSSHEPKNKVPDEFIISQNYPNPFSQKTIIRYWLKYADFVTIDIFNILGEKIDTIVNSLNMADEHVITFNAKNLSPGVYFYRIHGKNFSQTKKLILLK